ncbi:MAG TPA: nucleotidyltransferase family protein [Opitutaceae bacterium]
MAEPGNAAPAPGFGAVILAAGGSSRMGQAKQLLEVDGVPLLLRVVDEALGSGADPVVVVLGASLEKIRPAVAGRNVVVSHNPDWAAGLSTSIRAGMATLLAIAPDAGAVLLTPCDQPALSSAIFSGLADLQRSTGRIACVRFGGRNASPAVFPRGHFPALQNLSGDHGARELLNAGPEKVEALEAPALGVDFDTLADYEDWTRNSRRDRV